MCGGRLGILFVAQHCSWAPKMVSGSDCGQILIRNASSTALWLVQCELEGRLYRASAPNMCETTAPRMRDESPQGARPSARPSARASARTSARRFCAITVGRTKTSHTHSLTRSPTRFGPPVVFPWPPCRAPLQSLIPWCTPSPSLAVSPHHLPSDGSTNPSAIRPPPGTTRPAPNPYQA